MAQALATIETVAASITIDTPPVVLEIFASVPGWAIVHAATDNRNAPLICRGEVVVVDTGSAYVTGGWYPTEGGLFLAEYVSPPPPGALNERRSREIVQTYTNSRGHWHAGSIRRGSSVDGVLYCSDGPYRDEFHLASKLIGKVVGILASPSLLGRA